MFLFNLSITGMSHCDLHHQQQRAVMRSIKHNLDATCRQTAPAIEAAIAGWQDAPSGSFLNLGDSSV